MWAYQIAHFFDLQSISEIEKQSALRIERFFKNAKKQIVKEQFTKLTYKLRGFAANVLDLPNYIIIMILQNFTVIEKCRLKLVCTKLRDCANDPHLSKAIHINNNS